MTDIRAVCKVFLDFVYDNEMIPMDIIKIIDENDSKSDPEYSVKWDIRVILDLLKYKEKYKPGNATQKTYQIKKEISEMCYLLSDRECDSLLREWLVSNRRQIGDAVDFCNDFFHNVKNDSGIKTFCTNLKELIENSKIEQASDYIKEIDDIINNCAFSQTYPIFEGTFDQFYEYMSGYIRNKVQQLTKKYKKNGCEYCGSTDKEIEAAHKNESDRKSITSDIFAKLAKKLDDNNAVINVKDFADEINSIHSNPDNFHFLCRECHEKYHKGEISDEMLVNKNQPIKSQRKARKISNNTKEKTGTSRWKIGEIARKYIFSVIKEGKITDYEAQKLKEYGYSKDIFGINYPLLSKERFINGRPRYYANRVQIDDGEYYICQEWYETSRQKLKDWLENHGVIIED